ncbi:MAG: hypothetical protein R3C19_26410 [Planctomycetaceae bacterium]
MISRLTNFSPHIAGVVSLLRQLSRECRSAERQGLDVTTFERILTDRHRAGD